MESGRAQPGMVRLLLVLVLAVFVACAETGPASDGSTIDAKRAEGVDREEQGVHEFFELVDYCREILLSSSYFDSLAEVILASVSLGLEPPYDETAVINVTLGPVGFVEKLELNSVTSPAIEAPFRLFIEAPPSLPRAPRKVQTCLGPRPFPLVVTALEHYQCLAQPEYQEYQQDVQRRFYKILYSSRFSNAPGHGWVSADLTLGSEGQMRELKMRGRSDALTIAKFRRAWGTLGPLPPPPEFSRCFAEKPLRIRVEVQGE